MKPTPLLLIVPLAWASFGLAESASQQPSSAHAWRQSQATDAVRSINFTRYTLLGKFLSAPHDAAPDRPALVLDCIPGNGSRRFLAANLLVGRTLKIVYVEPEEIHGTSYYPEVAVRYQTDSKEGQEAKWSPGTDKTSASIPKESLKDILRAHTVAITTDDDQGAEVVMRFDMPDPTLVENGCNVDEH
jgi:hypothetical protein